MSSGPLPYSSVGYNMAKANNDVASEEARSVTSFAGDGGLHQLYVGLGVKVLKNLSVGANISYFWGEITRQARITFPYNDNAIGHSKGSHRIDRIRSDGLRAVGVRKRRSLYISFVMQIFFRREHYT